MAIMDWILIFFVGGFIIFIISGLLSDNHEKYAILPASIYAFALLLFVSYRIWLKAKPEFDNRKYIEDKVNELVEKRIKNMTSSEIYDVLNKKD